tara:strand:+ start:223 stop:525 length:303 start_codon:yes stop_codon:yes gene_type:complete
MVDKKIKIKGQSFKVKECKTGISKLMGLMFQTKPRNLLFIFKRPTRQPIHSLFCKPFRAVWLRKGKIIDDKIVKPFSLSVRPKEKFTQLVEIPLGNYDKT